MTTYVVPAHHVAGDSGHTDRHNEIADDLGLIQTAVPLVSGGLTGATAAARIAGATATGSPGSGTFATGDAVIAQDGKIWICTAGGSPGTWAQVGAGGGGAMTNPMTTPGDLIDGGTAGAPQRLGIGSAGQALIVSSGAPAWGAVGFAGGGTGQATQQAALDALAGAVTSGQVLRGTGTHVTLAALQAGDVPGFDGVTVTGTPTSGMVPTATGGSAASWQAPAAVDQPWQFRPETYGAKGDGKVFADGVTNGTTTFTSATAGFTSADTGKHIMINGGNGNPGAPVITTITFVNATTVTLGTAAGASATGCAFVYGTDDTAAINSAISAASTYAQANNFMAEVLLKASIYVVTSLTQETVPATYNTQLLIPFPNANGTTRKLMLTFRGAGYMAPCQYWESTAPNVQGSAIVSMQTAPFNVDATFGRQSVIGGPTNGSLTGGFANTHLTVLDLSVWCPGYTNMRALDMFLLSGCHLDGYSSQVFMPANNLSGATAAHPYLNDLPAQALFTNNSLGVGIMFPNTSNNDAVTFGDITVEGFEVGIQGQDHLSGKRYAGLYCDVILKIAPGTSHEVSIQSVSAEAFNGGILVSGGAYCRLNIGWDGEVTSPAYDISANSATFGIVRWSDTFHAAPIVSAAGNLKIVNDNLGPGFWSGAPAAPASTSSQQNTAWRDAWITLSATTGITAITVDGQTTGLTAGNNVAVQIRVPSGKSYAVTYTGTLTAKWWLD